MNARRRAAQRGATTIVMIAVLVLGMALTLGAARVGAALVGRARAQTAADAAALAAADTIALGGDAERAHADAASIADANGARLESCACAPPRLTVTVAVDVPVVGRVARVSASAEVRGSVFPDP